MHMESLDRSCFTVDKGISIDEMSLDELHAVSPVFKEDIYEAVSMETCVNKRLTVGAPAKEAMESVITAYEQSRIADRKSVILLVKRHRSEKELFKKCRLLLAFFGILY